MLLHVAVFVVRIWVRTYTWRMSARAGHARRAEIDSDLWEMLNDSPIDAPTRSAAAIFARLVEGIPADLAWRFEQASQEQQLVVRRFIALGAALTAVAVLWSVPALLLNGRREVHSCAETTVAPYETAALRHEIIRCAGAFFSAAR